eukprot:CAMPEP_0170076718 /NCGR_PEP_ID=MMETSP0019_2-20121128/13673_1 /TAXON_ID=98059 /ORGANISM="Dinobryon sp., Strain UTEXLB2267" /LENGTH=217 /DNA_ID=CAMNT_0010288603 /DNA_START=208 /DNA_END=861 /DNA_ORIENTATION=-
MRVDSSMDLVYDEMAQKIISLASNRGSQLLIGIAGPPGVGKSTISSQILSRLDNESTIIVPMDGFHYSKETLLTFSNSSEAFARRGAHWTFNGKAFVNKLQTLKATNGGLFPSFSHGSGNPVEDAIEVVAQKHQIVIVEGNYLLLDIKPWNEIRSLLDFIFFIESDLETIKKRVYGRHFSLGYGEEVSMRRVLTNDLPNAELVLSTKHRADEIILSR